MVRNRITYWLLVAACIPFVIFCGVNLYREPDLQLVIVDNRTAVRLRLYAPESGFSMTVNPKTRELSSQRLYRGSVDSIRADSLGNARDLEFRGKLPSAVINRVNRTILGVEVYNTLVYN